MKKILFSESEIEIGHDNNQCNGLQNEYGEVRHNIVLEANDVLYVLEIILLFHAWYNVEDHLNVVAFLVEKKCIAVLLNYLRLVKMAIPH